MSAKHSHAHHAHSVRYQNVSQKELPDSEIEVSLEIPAAELEPLYKEALADIALHAEMPGFRKGHVPEKMIRERFGDLYILEEAVEHAMSHLYPNLIQELKLEPIGSPKVTITKLALGEAAALRLTIPLFPKFSLPDYKKIAKGIPAEKAEGASDKEVADVVKEIRRIRGGKEAESQDNAVLPALTDEEAAALGNFKNVAELEAAVRENLGKEKESRAREKRRLALIEELTAATEIALPAVLVESEMERMFARLESDLSRMRLTLPDYLKRVKKTEEDLRKEWEPEARKRVKLELILGKIAAAEHIAPEAEAVEKETDALIAHHEGADRERARAYVENLLTNDKVFEFLENQR
ncbi:MAG TPA: trigger factor [Candidatus Paceibacterota bacterium]|nr:trigger factor [Candidatus Paceibacterota bacterium]